MGIFKLLCAGHGLLQRLLEGSIDIQVADIENNIEGKVSHGKIIPRNMSSEFVAKKKDCIGIFYSTFLLVVC